MTAKKTAALALLQPVVDEIGRLGARRRETESGRLEPAWFEDLRTISGQARDRALEDPDDDAARFVAALCSRIHDVTVRLISSTDENAAAIARELSNEMRVANRFHEALILEGLPPAAAPIPNAD